ncbi:MAG TPA: HIT family protein, partial [Spirochaetota bacterium]|nr:HIT family protein [Spirochaetota bacterium]
MGCLFCNIIKGEVPSKKIYENERVYAFEDINPCTS